MLFVMGGERQKRQKDRKDRKSSYTSVVGVGGVAIGFDFLFIPTSFSFTYGHNAIWQARWYPNLYIKFSCTLR